MATRIEHAINRISTSRNSSNSFTLHYQVDDWNYLQARKLKKFQKTDNNFSDSMDRMLEKHNIESIKRTMQIHEEIFKHQVKELHRLYSVQKRLMEELKKESKQDTRIIWSSSEMNHATTTQTNSGYILNFQNVIDEDHVHDAAGPSNKMSIDDHNEESDVELTLSIGVSSSSSSRKNKKKSKGYQLGCLGEDSGCLNTPMSSSSPTFNQEKTMPHWLFGLSVNRS